MDDSVEKFPLLLILAMCVFSLLETSKNLKFGTEKVVLLKVMVGMEINGTAELNIVVGGNRTCVCIWSISLSVDTCNFHHNYLDMVLLLIRRLLT